MQSKTAEHLHFPDLPILYNGCSRMIELIEQNRQRIADLCRLYRVKKLDLFGSAASGEFDSARSDVDFFYEFDETDVSDIADRFFDLKDQLEALLGRKIDMVSARDAKNPYLLNQANRYRQTLYAACKNTSPARAGPSSVRPCLDGRLELASRGLPSTAGLL